MRKEIVFTKDGHESVHFTSDIKGVPAQADLWFKLEDSKDLFVNIENILTRLNEAFNITDITKISDYDYKVTYNKITQDNILDKIENDLMLGYRLLDDDKKIISLDKYKNVVYNGRPTGYSFYHFTRDNDWKSYRSIKYENYKISLVDYLEDAEDA